MSKSIKVQVRMLGGCARLATLIAGGAAFAEPDYFHGTSVLWKIGAAEAFETSSLTDQQYSRLGFLQYGAAAGCYECCGS